MDYRELLIAEDAQLIDALHKLDETAQKVLFVVRDGRLVAALSDGDIRRHIMQKGTLAANVSEMANYQPKHLAEDKRAEAEGIMQQQRIFAMPVVDEEMRIIDVIFRNGDDNRFNSGHVDLPVVINAGGKGTRLYPYTKILPKPLIPVGEKPISERIINHFQRLGCERFYMIVNEKKNMIKAYFCETDETCPPVFVDEEVPLGTGGGLKLLQEKLCETFIFTNCDTIIDYDFSKVIRMHRENQNSITMICATKSFTFPYGVVITGKNGAMEALREKPQMTYLTNTGCYIVEPQVIELIGQNEAVGFPTIVERCRDAGLPVGIYPISEHNWLDMGQFDTLEEMRIRLGETEQYSTFESLKQ